MAKAVVRCGVRIPLMSKIYLESSRPRLAVFIKYTKQQISLQNEFSHLAQNTNKLAVSSNSIMLKPVAVKGYPVKVNYNPRYDVDKFPD